ncbi:MAG: NAD(P)/FAD-dependent oxidoreductase [Clostridia bacterium]|nr:NAD(P)/FAD-dependent oxidoreductase [Clostridia bacterium]
MKTVVIGGGAAGMICAYYCAKNGESTVLLEQNEKLGKKIYITGKGRCNVTNDCDEEEFLANIVTNARFMRGAIWSYPPSSTMEFLQENGLKIKTERGNRVFPLSDKSSDVIKCFERSMQKVGVQVHLNCKVYNLLVNDGKIEGVKCSLGEISCDKVVVCTGGKSYSSTGSTGDGYAFAKSVGHTVTPIRSALCGLELLGTDFASLAGLTLKNIGFKVFKEQKEIYRDFGELLFTHTGVSGPVVISASSYISKEGNGNYTVSIDLKPALDEKTLDSRLLRDFAQFKGKVLKNSLFELLPKSLIPEVIRHSGISGEAKVSEFSAENRKKLLTSLKDLRYKMAKLRPLEECIVTGGGVNVKEINPSTMESKIIKGLYFAGEVVDVDALTGGFNLQCAFAMGYLAGNATQK